MEFFSHASPKPSTPRFTHLKVYSSYSLGVGVSTPAEICAHAARVGYRSVGLTDIGGTYGFVEFHLAAAQHGVKPIYGIVVRHQPGGRRGEEPCFVTLVAVSETGLRNVAALASLTATEDQGAALDMEVLAVHSEGVVAAIGSADTEIARAVREGDMGAAERAVRSFADVYGDRFFVEVQDHGQRDERLLSEKLLELATRTGTAPLLTQETRYVDRRLRDFYGALRGMKHPTEERDFFPTDPDPTDWSLRTPSEMLQLRPFYEAAYDNTSRIDDMIPGDLLGGIHGKREPSPDAAERARDEILELCRSAIRRRCGDRSEEEIARCRSIVESEAGHAAAEGRGSTILVFHRLMAALRESGVEPGPATGLDLQSLCARLLGITSFDPYRYDPRFHPGFDGRAGESTEFELQLAPETRVAAVHALFSMFDYGCVAFLPAVERITPAKAVRMAATVSSGSPAEVSEIQQALARHPGLPIDRVRELEGRLDAMFLRSVGAREVLSRAALLEDLPIGIVRSRRSLAISASPLTNFVGCSIDSETGDLFVQAGRENFPVPGVYRVDLTSLGALGVCVRTERQLREAKIADYGWDDFPTGEDDVWREVQRGDSTGIFLFEGQAAVQLREDFPLRSMSDLTNFLALMRSRDGTASLSDRMTAFTKESADLGGEADVIREIVSPTNGHVLYHEQIRDFITTLTSTDAGEAAKMVLDLWSASPAELAAARKRFMVGAADKNLPVEAAERWFERLMRYARTSMSRKRVFADALLVYKLFFLKTRHAPWFYAALLNANLESEGKLEKYIGSLRARGLLLGLDLNRSRGEFVVEDGLVRSGFAVVAGLDDEKIQRIVRARARRPFDSFDDFVKRVGARHFDRGDVRRLIEVGAFDAFDSPRSEMLARVSAKFAKRTAKERADAKGQFELPFDT